MPPAIETFGINLLAVRHLILAGSRHEILQEQDRYRGQFWATFDALCQACRGFCREAGDARQPIITSTNAARFSRRMNSTAFSNSAIRFSPLVTSAP